jgi:transcriptional regulator with XRE-family HTH domain
MSTEQLSIGEYIRRLRKKKVWSLQMVADHTGLSYHHLSRIENDSTVPGAETVAKVADALGGDLKLMLEMADCLPRQILDRISSRPEATSATLKRAAGGGSQPSGANPEARALAFVRAAGIPESEETEVANAVIRLVNLDRKRRHAIVQLLEGYVVEEPGGKR